jgi:hypothetical protein
MTLIQLIGADKPRVLAPFSILAITNLKIANSSCVPFSSGNSFRPYPATWQGEWLPRDFDLEFQSPSHRGILSLVAAGSWLLAISKLQRPAKF